MTFVYLEGGPFDGQLQEPPAPRVAIRIKTLTPASGGSWSARDDVYIPTDRTLTAVDNPLWLAQFTGQDEPPQVYTWVPRP